MTAEWDAAKSQRPPISPIVIYGVAGFAVVCLAVAIVAVVFGLRRKALRTVPNVARSLLYDSLDRIAPPTIRIEVPHIGTHAGFRKANKAQSHADPVFTQLNIANDPNGDENADSDSDSTVIE